MKRVVIADAGPLIALARLGQLAWLPRLFGKVHVTPWVASELVVGGEFPESSVLREALAQPWLETVDLATLGLADWETSSREWMHLHQIDPGEATALAWASHLAAHGDAPLLVMDDFRARAAAGHARLPVVGTAGLLLLARQNGMVTAVRPWLERLRIEGYYLSDALIEAVAAQAGE